VGAPTDQLVMAASQSAPALTIQGTARVGSTVAVSGDWAAGTVLTYQWTRDGVAIEGAVSSQYNVAAADRGSRLAVRVLGVRSGYTDAVATSPATEKVLEAAGSATPAPGAATVRAGQVSIDGSAQVGRTVRARTSGWEATATLLHQWYRSGTAIPGATQASYRAVAADRGQDLTVRVIGTVEDKVAVAKVSAATKVAAGTIKVAKVSIKGWVLSGYRLSAKVTGVTDGAQATYQWISRGKVIGTKSALRVPSSAKKSPIVLKVTFSKAGYQSAVRTRITPRVR